MNRRHFIKTAALSPASFTTSSFPRTDNAELQPIWAQIEKRHDESLRRLQDRIRQPAIAAENRGMHEGCELMMQLLREAGFAQVSKIPTDGHPGVFALHDAGAPRTLGIYFMYDVKQADPTEWSSPPFDAALVDKPGLGKALVGRGATNQKGPQATLLATLHAIRGAGKRLPVNLVFVAEGEEEIGSPHFPQVIARPEVNAALRRCSGVFMPFPSQDPSGEVTINPGAKGVIELELVASGERWGRGPRRDTHSSNKARLDSPAWHLAPRSIRWSPPTAIRPRLRITPTINIEGLVGGYTGPGGKTILPHRAVAKLDLRLAPDMTAAEALAALKAHLAQRGFGDIEVNMTGGYDPTSTATDAALAPAMAAVYKRAGIEPLVMPRLAGSWPGYVFTGAPLRLPAGHFGLGHGGGAHAPDEYYVIESANPKVQGMEGATRSYVEYLFELSRNAPDPYVPPKRN